MGDWWEVAVEVASRQKEWEEADSENNNCNEICIRQYTPTHWHIHNVCCNRSFKFGTANKKTMYVCGFKKLQ